MRSTTPRKLAHRNGRMGGVAVPDDLLASEALRVVAWLESHGDQAPEEAVWTGMKWSLAFAGMVRQYATERGLIERRHKIWHRVEDGGLSAVAQQGPRI